MDSAPIARLGIPRQLESMKPSLEQLGDVQPSPELPRQSGSFAALLRHSLLYRAQRRVDQRVAEQLDVAGEAPALVVDRVAHALDQEPLALVLWARLRVSTIR